MSSTASPTKLSNTETGILLAIICRDLHGGMVGYTGGSPRGRSYSEVMTTMGAEKVSTTTFVPGMPGKVTTSQENMQRIQNPYYTPRPRVNSALLRLVDDGLILIRRGRSGGFNLIVTREGIKILRAEKAIPESKQLQLYARAVAEEPTMIPDALSSFRERITGEHHHVALETVEAVLVTKLGPKGREKVEDIMRQLSEAAQHPEHRYPS